MSCVRANRMWSWDIRFLCDLGNTKITVTKFSPHSYPLQSWVEAEMRVGREYSFPYTSLAIYIMSLRTLVGNTQVTLMPQGKMNEQPFKAWWCVSKVFKCSTIWYVTLVNTVGSSDGNGNCDTDMVCAIEAHALESWSLMCWCWGSRNFKK
jgi:hypothetical protein